MLDKLPWDLAPQLPWHVFTSPAQKWAVQPSFVIGEGSGAELFWGQDRLAWVRDRLRSPLRA